MIFSTNFFDTEEKNFATGTPAYFDIPLVVNTQGLVMAKVKDCKAAARALPSKTKAQNQPQVKADLFGEGSEIGGSDDDAPIGDNHQGSKTIGASNHTRPSDPLAGNPYKIIRTRTENQVVTDADLGGLAAFDESDLPEIALVNDATLYSARNGIHRNQQYYSDDNQRHRPQHEEPAMHHTTRVHWDQSSDVRQGSERRTETHEHYKVPHRGDLGGHQYRRLVVDIPNPQEGNEVPPITRAIPPQRRSTGPQALPISKARIAAPPSRTATRVPKFYEQPPLQPSARQLPPTHPANRIPPLGQKFGKGKDKMRVHSAQSNIQSRGYQDEQEFEQPNSSHLFIRQRLPRDGQAGPSREIFLTREEEERRRQSFVMDAYENAVYEDEDEN